MLLRYEIWINFMNQIGVFVTNIPQNKKIQYHFFVIYIEILLYFTVACGKIKEERKDVNGY